jgi:hypothetical protein
MNTKNNPKKAGVKRRDFLVNLPLAAAALTLNSAFGFPVSTEQGGGKLFWKMTDVNGTKSSDGSFQFSPTDLELLKSGKMESLALKVEISYDQRRWQSLNTTITDKYFMKQLTEIAQKA